MTIAALQLADATHDSVRQAHLKELLEYLGLDQSTENFFYLWFRCSPSYVCLNRDTGIGYDLYHKETVEVTQLDWDCSYDLGADAEFTMGIQLQQRIEGDYQEMYYQYCRQLKS
ncbi:hypothetical protein [Acinetobacter sp. YH12153]|uniref:hypothetical protein n=1 Tax=Acinetobacter sp. YH12153 TaxID=2601133 RepID=UPI0015D293D5|nr:hypothetical protein [Acinetobacter sp. YH12153]